MTILLIGGTGKSATPLAKLLLRANIPVILTTRSGNVPAPFKGVRFDWLDASTYENPFAAATDIDRVYLIPPPVADMFPPMKVFIDFAIHKGVKRFVLMSAGMIEAGGLLMGKVHEYLQSLGVEYCALRPSWFFDNLLLHYSDYIRKNEIANAAGSGLIGWISTDDIADVAFKALTDPVIEHSNPIMVGPELFSYAQSFVDEYTQVMVQRGMPEDYAAIMSAADGLIAEGSEERLFNRADFVGKRMLRQFVEEHKEAKEWRAEA